MVGHVTDREARIWVRLNGPHSVRVRYAPADGGDGELSAAVRAEEEDDFTAVVPLAGLSPDTAYRYAVEIEDGIRPELPGGDAPVFRTLPPAGEPGVFRIAFGSCASYEVDPPQRIWRAAARARPHAFLWLGDNIYADTHDPIVFRRKYRRQRAVESLRPFQASVPQLAVWDDHDYGTNDGDRGFPAKEASLKVFREYWPNPAYGSADAPGVFFRWSIGNVDFFLLDTRYHRDPNFQPDGPAKSLLGPQQKAWLLAGLKESRAAFKVLVSSSVWTEQRGPFSDAWGAFQRERDEIFDFIRDEGVTGVFLLSGDAHRPQINAIPWSDRGGYDLYEIVSSPLAQGIYRGWFWPGEYHAIRPVDRLTVNFGLLEFDTRADPPQVTVRLLDDAGNSLWTPLVLTVADLWPGAQTWTRKQDPPKPRS